MAKDMSSNIVDIYQNQLGRMPTQAEVDSLNQYSNNGSVPLTSMDLQQIVQGTPEFQQKQLQNFGGQYQNMLGASDQRILGLSQNAITQQFAQQGRNIGSSGYLGAYANAAANLAMSRQQQMANFYGGGYQGIMDNTAGQAQQAQGYGQSQMASTLGFSRQQQLMQQYQNILNQQNAAARKSGMFGSIGGLIGGLGAGALSNWNPGIMQAGSSIGKGFGEYAAGPQSVSFGGGGGNSMYPGGYSAGLFGR